MSRKGFRELTKSGQRIRLKQVLANSLTNKENVNDSDEMPILSENEMNNPEYTLNNYENSDEDNFQDENNDFLLNSNKPLYTGAPVTLEQSMLMILSLQVKHNLTQSCVADIIDCINLHCINDNLYMNSLHKFNKFFKIESAEPMKHYVCTKCAKSLTSTDEVCTSCHEKFDTSYFIEMPLLSQLSEMFKRKQFHEKLQQRFYREVSVHNMSDVYDGDIYKKHIESGFLTNPNHISLSWYTDGVPVFKTSKVAIWPFYLTINELPFKMRTNRENIMLAGLWFGDKKPLANMFLLKLHNQLERLYRGVNISIPNGNAVTVRCILLYGTCDLPAKAQFLNMTQFNGLYGCTTCLEPGETFHFPQGGYTHVYKYKEIITLRTTETSINLGHQAMQTNKAVMGVKGPCALSNLMPDFISGTGIDRMHGVDGGVARKLLNLWFNAKYRAAPFSLIPVKDIIDQRLKTIKPPKFVHRLPRSIDDLMHWKASELKMWLFYYSLPILNDVVRPDFFFNYMLLVLGVSILSADTIPINMIDKANEVLHKFVQGFQNLYGLEHCSINIHQLLHLAVCVKNLGPLWACTCYPFEDLNGKLLQLIHGTSHIDSQISRSHMQFIIRQKLWDELPEGKIKEFCTRKKHQVYLNEKISTHCYSVGAYRAIDNLSTVHIRPTIQEVQIYFNNIMVYSRLLKDDKIFIAELYSREKTTKSSFVLFTSNNQQYISSIYCFIKAMNNCSSIAEYNSDSLKHFAIIQKYTSQKVFNIEANNGRTMIDHLYECIKTNDIVIVPVSDLKCVCICMVVEDKVYIATPINTRELE